MRPNIAKNIADNPIKCAMQQNNFSKMLEFLSPRKVNSHEIDDNLSCATISANALNSQLSQA